MTLNGSSYPCWSTWVDEFKFRLFSQLKINKVFQLFYRGRRMEWVKHFSWIIRIIFLSLDMIFSFVSSTHLKSSKLLSLIQSYTKWGHKVSRISIKDWITFNDMFTYRIGAQIIMNLRLIISNQSVICKFTGTKLSYTIRWDSTLIFFLLYETHRS